MKDESVFPKSGEWTEHPEKDTLLWTGSIGLTKRELFAAMAMQGLCADKNTAVHAVTLGREIADYRAGHAVAHADALLAALEKDGANE